MRRFFAFFSWLEEGIITIWPVTTGIALLKIEEILIDLSLSFFLHKDLRPANIIQAPKDTEECPVHKYVHRWNLIDFAWTIVDQPERDNREKLNWICEEHLSLFTDDYFLAGSHPKLF
ncbi:hypothetical protein BN946_scf184806.g14 [Trametes cinnabarina]|uniref:Protein kinase domain-containing protein n=1 Tax=Pycnoporus cinnabarinus TaxID=5643 RepID=A0A060S6H3_PYCCI|nr:hypothetical protein BN946_scf184806.g14 [Trametes cinnabarina]